MSLRLRLSLAAMLVLAIFLGLTTIVLERGFGDALRQGINAQLQARVYMLLAAAELTPDGQLRLPPHLPEARLSTPGSGLYARALDERAQAVWVAPSSLGAGLPAANTVAVGQQRFEYLRAAENPPGDRHGLFRLGFGVEWEGEDGRLWPFTLEVFEDDTVYLAQRREFRHTLGYGLGAVAIALLLVQALVLAWGMQPLARVTRDLEAIRAGRRDHLEGPYPKELAPFSDSINRFIDQERAARDRYRDSLGELAHSLKTPLAVLRGSLEAAPDGSSELGGAGGGEDCGRDTALAQLQRMGDIVNYQLARAATGGRSPLAAPVAIEAVATSLTASLDKVYRDRDIRCELNIADGISFYGDRGDLLELLGNLLDNAYKWARHSVLFGAVIGSDGGLLLSIDDDGPGIDAQDLDQVLRRGLRADERVDGQGIGLAVVRDLVEAYDGRLLLCRNPLGGLRVEMTFPQQTV